MASPFEQAWMLLKNVMDYGEIASELPDVEEPTQGIPAKFSDLEPMPVPPEFQYKKPSNLVSPTGRLGDIPLDERGIREMSPVPQQ